MPKIDDDKKNKRKQIIINSALKCFSEKGFAKTTMDDIVKESGVSKGGIYLYYKSKDEIFREIADEVIANRKSMIEDFDEELSYSDKLRTYIKNILENYEKPAYKKKIRFTFEFWVVNKDKKNIGNISKKKYLDERFNNAISDIEIILKGGAESGEFRDDVNTETFIHILFAALDGIAFFSGLLDKVNPKNIETVFADIFENYLKNKS